MTARACVVVALAFVFVGGGCKKESTAGSEPVAAEEPVVRASAAPPVDHLAPDELVEGEKKAFGILLPRGLEVDGAFADVFFTSGQQLGVHPLVKYFRARLTEGSLREGEEAATFEHVHVPGKKDLELSVHIRTAGNLARVELRDTTPKPEPNLPDDTARWRRVGMAPNGRLLDPTHLD
jgi:hypothetical protein